MTPAEVAALRAQVYAAGFRPVEIQNPVLGDKLTGKRPRGERWQIEALSDPPPAVANQPHPQWLNTGIYTGGLRAVDIDIDNPTLARACHDHAVTMLGATLVRRRSDSPRCCLLYRAAVGAPRKLILAGRDGKIEVLGEGNQFVAFGAHYETLAELEWEPHPPGVEMCEDLPAVTEDAVAAFLERCAPIIAANYRQETNGHDHTAGEAQADPLRIAAALNDIPNDGPPNWDAWNRVGLAVWAATGGNREGWIALDAWSRRHGNYDPKETRLRWDHYFKSPPDRIGAGTIFHLARKARDARARPEPGHQRDVPPDTAHIPYVTFSEINEVSEPQDFIENLLTMGAMSVIYGQSNCGKSFFALDLAMHVVAGHQWREQEVDRGAVLYLALEGGQQGIRNRLMAVKQEHGWDAHDLPFAFIATPIDLRRPDADLEPLIATIRHVAERFIAIGCPVRWTIVDTLARALAGGNENASEDMGALVINCDRLRAVTGCHLSLLHHSGKDEAKGARGHSSLVAATDTEIEIVDNEGTRTATITKQRDLETLPPFAFTLRAVEIGTNRRGKPITTCLVDYGGEPAERRHKKPNIGGGPARGHATRALEILTDVCASSGIRGFRGVPDDVLSVPEDWWRERFYERAMPGEKPDSKKHAFRRAANALITQHLVGMASNRVWIVAGES